jgi:hypothetical protein
MRDSLMEEVTNEFCDTYKTKADCRGWSCSLIPSCLPEGVDPTDPRVVQIVEWCKEVASEQSE